jgi:hypothetical protein
MSDWMYYEPPRKKKKKDKRYKKGFERKGKGNVRIIKDEV